MEVQGKIIRLVRHRGFGFIKSENHDDDIFFHHSKILNSYFDEMKEGQNVVFSLLETDKGLEAVDISIDRSVPTAEDTETLYEEIS